MARRMGMKANMAYALIGLALAGRGGADPGWSARLHGAADQALADLGPAPFLSQVGEKDPASASRGFRLRGARCRSRPDQAPLLRVCPGSFSSLLSSPRRGRGL